MRPSTTALAAAFWALIGWALFGLALASQPSGNPTTVGAGAGALVFSCFAWIVWTSRTRPTPAPPPRPNYTAIAVMEHDEFGIQPEPGTAAALVIGLRKAVANCTAHQPVDTTTLSQVGRRGVCTRCGCDMVQDGDGEWVKT